MKIFLLLFSSVLIFAVVWIMEVFFSVDFFFGWLPLGDLRNGLASRVVARKSKKSDQGELTKEYNQ